jgi:uncharacterized membrane protein YeiH
MLIEILDLFGVAVFAITGSLVARRKNLDVFGVLVIAGVTALGGGTLRDMMLGTTPVFWIVQPQYLLVVIGAVFVTFLLAYWEKFPRRSLLIADAFGLALFTVLGTQTALEQNVNPMIAIFMGMITGVAGGMIRDLLSDEIPLILQKEIYATASISGGLVFVLFSFTNSPESFSMICGMLTTLALRLMALKWHWSLPLFIPHKRHLTKNSH